MQDMIAAGAAWFDSQRREHMATTVAYLPVGATGPVNVRATIGSSRWENVDAAGNILRFETRDYMISTADRSTTPARGDRITEVAADGTSRTYEVYVPGGASNPWQWADRGQRIRRIHTQQV